MKKPLVKKRLKWSHEGNIWRHIWSPISCRIWSPGIIRFNLSSLKTSIFNLDVIGFSETENDASYRLFKRANISKYEGLWILIIMLDAVDNNSSMCMKILLWVYRKDALGANGLRIIFMALRIRISNLSLEQVLKVALNVAILNTERC